jgi:hypothetical protein
MTNRFLLGSLAVGLGLSTVAVAQEPGKDALKGAEVTLTGCVATDKENSFVLTNVEEVSAPRSTTSTATPMAMSGMEGGGPNEVIYWLSHDSVKLMRGHLGHKVEVTGIITDLSMGTVRVKQEPGKAGPDNKIEVEARGKEATAETDKPVGSGPVAVVKSDVTHSLPVRRVKVETVKLLANTCK